MLFSETVCKERWKSLRDGYHRSIKRRKGRSGEAATKNKIWKYEQQMEFLRPFFQERNSVTNLEESVTTDEDKKDDNLMENVDSPGQDTPPWSTSLSKKVTKRKKTSQLEVAAVQSIYLEKRTATDPRSEDPVHSFFSAMADTVKHLPPSLQLKVKNKVYAVVSEAEYENINKQHPGPP